MKVFEENKIYLMKEQEKKFVLFGNLLEKYNAEFNITAIESGEKTEIKHFLDSVMGVDNFPPNASVIEVGSGGGFPSVPLMIMRNDLRFTLVESTGKKCVFLEKVKSELNLNCTVLNARAEDLGRKKEYREVFDISTARAVARLNTLSEYCLPLIKVGGSFIAYKGSADEEIKEARNAIAVLGGKIKEIKNYELPYGEGKRTIIEIEKVSKTPSLYPRGNGKEKKKPL